MLPRRPSEVSPFLSVNLVSFGTVLSFLLSFREDLAENSFLGIDYSGTSRCTDVNVGYDLNTEVFGLDLGGNGRRVVIKALSGSLVLNAVAAGAAGISLFFAFFAWFCSSRLMEIVSLRLLPSSPLLALFLA